MGRNDIVYECMECGGMFYCREVIKGQEVFCPACHCPMLLAHEEALRPEKKEHPMSLKKFEARARASGK